MARYIIQAPDGSRHIIEGPGGPAAAPAAQAPGPAATPPVARPDASSQPFERAGGLTATGAGVADFAIKGALGIKQLFGGLSDENKAVLREMEAEKKADPEATSRGRTEFGMNFLPAVGASRVPALTKSMGALSAKAPALAAALSGGVQTAALTPVEGDTYSDQMVNKAKEGAVAGVISGGLTKALKFLSQPFKPTAEAEKLFSQGVNPTLHQGAAGRPGKFVGGLTPGAFKPEIRQKDEIANAWLRKATEGNRELGEGTGREFVESADDYVSSLYNKLWGGKKTYISPKDRNAIYEEVAKIHPTGRGARASQEATAELMEVLGQSPTNAAGRTKNEWFTVPELRKEVRNKLTRAAMDASDDARTRLLTARDMLDDITTNKVLTNDEKAILLRANNLTFDVKRGEEALRGGKGSAEGLDIQRLNKAYEATRNQAASMGNTTHEDLVAPAARMMSSAGKQQSMRSALIAAGRTAGPIMAAGAVGGGIPGAGLTALALAPVYGTSLVGQTAGGAKALMGQYAKQKELAKLLRDPNFALMMGAGANASTGE